MKSLSNLNILVIGDVMVDRFWHGKCSRISPEAPVPVVNISNIDDRLGGAANAASNLASIGCNVSLYGLIGSDAIGDTFKKLLAQSSIANFCQEKLDQTILKLRVLTKSQQMIRLDFEDSVLDDLAYEFASSDLLTQLISQNDLILLSDYLKGSLKYANNIINLCKNLGKKVVVDPKSPSPLIYQSSSILTPNKREFESFFGSPIATKDLQSHAESLIKRLNLDAIVITLSENGILCVTPSEARLMPTVAREVVDVTGAGDVFVAWLSAMYASGCGIFESCSLANTAAGLSVERVGTVRISHQDIANYTVDKGSPCKFYSSGDEFIRSNHFYFARHASQKIVFTNGCFDVIHAGHISYLSAAKDLGDILIIGINDDCSVSRLKGMTRPVNSLDNRVKVLSALSCVDYIIPFSEDTPIDLIKSISPHVLVKGGDYSVEEIVGYSYVKSNGGTVKVLPLIEGLSTSAILSRLQGI